jgi:hypothetical protein
MRLLGFETTWQIPNQAHARQHERGEEACRQGTWVPLCAQGDFVVAGWDLGCGVDGVDCLFFCWVVVDQKFLVSI